MPTSEPQIPAEMCIRDSAGAVAAIWIRGSMDKKTERLVGVARLYYEQDRTQNEIAGRYGISRPMVSKLVKEARDRGIVSIRICAPQEEDVYKRQAYGNKYPV